MQKTAIILYFTAMALCLLIGASIVIEVSYSFSLLTFSTWVVFIVISAIMLVTGVVIEARPQQTGRQV